MPDYRFTVTLVLRAPIISQAAGGRKIGVDAAALCVEEHPALPGSLIRGNLRHAWERFDKSVPGRKVVPSEDKIRNWLGHESKDDSNDEPWRARLQFAAYWKALAGRSEGTRHRITLNPKTSTVENRHLQIIESPFATGVEVAYRGYIDASCEDEAEVDQLERWIRKGLEFTPALGAFKGAGFGRIISVNVERASRPSLLVGTVPPDKPRFGIRLMLDRPFCFAKHHTPDSNRYESEAFIPGGAILGAMARRLFPHGNQILRENFNAIRVTHAFPSGENGKRPVVLPLSLVFNPDQDGKIYDVARKDKPGLIHGRAGIFQIDWKGKHWGKACVISGWPGLSRVIAVRTEINKKTGTAYEGKLFATEAIVPENRVWLADVDLSAIPEARRETVTAALRDFLAIGLDMLGKTKAVAQIEFMGEPTTPTAESRDLVVDGITIVTLQSAARLLPYSGGIPPTNGGKQLFDLYKAAWHELSDHTLDLQRFYAQQQLVGGQYLWRRFHQGAPSYNPELLTVPGSVFVLKLAGDEKTARCRLRAWLDHGLPLLSSDPYGEDWETNPYIRANGYGRVAINLKVHWDHEPKEGEWDDELNGE